MTDGQVCCGCIVVHPDDDVELNVAAADWRCWRRAYSCQQGSAASCYLDTGGLSGRAWTWHDLPHRANASDSSLVRYICKPMCWPTNNGLPHSVTIWTPWNENRDIPRHNVCAGSTRWAWLEPLCNESNQITTNQYVLLQGDWAMPYRPTPRTDTHMMSSVSSMHGQVDCRPRRGGRDLSHLWSVCVCVRVEPTDKTRRCRRRPELSQKYMYDTKRRRTTRILSPSSSFHAQLLKTAQRLHV